MRAGIQSSLAQVLLIAFISPPFWSKILTPGTKRAERVRFCLRLALNVVKPFL